MIDPPAVIAQAREWLGVKFLHQGRSRHGADCLGFIAAVMDELGSPELMANLPHNYSRNPNALLADGMPGLSREIALQPAAMLLIKFPYGKVASHAAIYTGESMIHCFQAEGKVIEHGYRAPWIDRTISIWALPMVAYT